MTDAAAAVGEGSGESETRLSATGRVEAFSDGVMAIAITLLVLDLRVPTVAETSTSGLGVFLAGQWPTYVAYLAAFLSIGVIWLNHSALVDVIARFDRRLHWLNLMLLLGVATLPFPTALMAEFVAEGSHDASLATALYGALALVMALPWTFIWRHLRDRPDLLEPGYDAAFADAAIRRNIWGPLIYAAATAVAFVEPLVALVLYVLIAVFFAAVRQGSRPAANQR
ncbi:MAG TPA: TMEM175 family protein [Candidatus Limnocylindrales bacterium]|nr:TMEM175 family protein [Candidatus Limnocylindrales bacterium]